MDQPFRRCHLKIFLFLVLVAILFSGAEQFVKILLEGLMSVKLVEPAVSRCGLKIFLFLTLLVINICNT